MIDWRFDGDTTVWQRGALSPPPAAPQNPTRQTAG